MSFFQPETEEDGTMPARVSVVGGGISGLTAASLLGRLGIRVTVYEAAGMRPGEAFDDPIGIWSPALRVLEQIGIRGGDVHLPGQFVRHVSGYHDATGNVLVGPSKALGSGDSDRPSLFFVRRSHLLQALRASCPESSVGFVRYNQPGDDSAGSAVDDAGLGAHLVIGADGMHSHLRRHVPGAEPVEDLRFFVVRGVARRGESVLPERTDVESGRRVRCSFQAWGPKGRRFAAVPCGGGDAAWFLTGRGTAPPCSHVSGLALAGRFAAGFEECAVQLVNLTAARDMALPYQAQAHSGRQVRMRRVACMPRGVPLALVGDAAHTLDPILAQGAGVAVEDAAALARVLTGWEPSEGDLAHRLHRYEALRAARLRPLVAISHVASFLGQMQPAWPRDQAVRLLPEVVKRTVFDALMLLSLAPAPLAGAVDWRRSP